MFNLVQFIGGQTIVKAAPTYNKRWTSKLKVDEINSKNHIVLPSKRFIKIFSEVIFFFGKS